MDVNPWKEEGRMTELSATLKYGKGYEDSWLVIRADNAADLKKAIEEATGLSGEGLSVVDLIHNASSHVHQVSKMGTALGATVIAEKTEEPAAPAQEQAAAPAAPAPEAPAPSLEDQIASAKSASELSDLFLKNKAAFTGDKALMDKLQERSKQV